MKIAGNKSRTHGEAESDIWVKGGTKKKKKNSKRNTHV